MGKSALEETVERGYLTVTRRVPLTEAQRKLDKGLSKHMSEAIRHHNALIAGHLDPEATDKAYQELRSNLIQVLRWTAFMSEVFDSQTPRKIARTRDEFAQATGHFV